MKEILFIPFFLLFLFGITIGQEVKNECSIIKFENPIKKNNPVEKNYFNGSGKILIVGPNDLYCDNCVPLYPSPENSGTKRNYVFLKTKPLFKRELIIITDPKDLIEE